MKNIGFIAALAAGLAITPAAAQEAVQAPVRYGDLNIASPAGTQKLAERFEAGAKAVCGTPDIRNLREVSAFHECKDAVVANGIEQLASKGITIEADQLFAN